MPRKKAGQEKPAPAVSPEFAALVEEFKNNPAVALSRMFGSTGLKCHGKIFAMEVKGHLVVKLSEKEVLTNVAAGLGEHFDPGHGKRMKEWLSIPPQHKTEWKKFAHQALAFACG